ncbi:replication initiator protein A [Staphylococcus agnetis]|uniref:replication initiator protein A n=1 Tax=Staphylococcus agnetis TaxID=985762 RepID=UPI00208EEDF7|nr:replication initiator protein A [Staphylococcus agnetis]MCO4346321.1 replication initiator protein A [Staphylococcus agnetis]MCO4360603.1 replication initiator protein A [Staphylococcus agnetis]
MSNKYYLEENFRERFYQLPKVFFTNPEYTKLSNDAKIAYAILRDRLDLSIKNRWIDEENAIYFIYTNDNLMSILNLGKNKVVNVKKELENAGLLEQKRVGLNKPNRLYLMKPVITEEDIFSIQNEEMDAQASDDKEVYKTNFQKFKKQTSRSLKNKLQEVYKTNSNDTDISDTDISDTDISDTDINTTTTTHNTEYDHNKQGGGSGENSTLKKTLEKELGISIPNSYVKKIEQLSQNMKLDLVNFAITYAAEKGNNPKQYLSKILATWKEHNVTTIEQAKDFKANRRNAQTTNPRNMVSKEKTPRWLTHPEEFELQPEDDTSLSEEVSAFKKHLESKQRIRN